MFFDWSKRFRRSLGWYVSAWYVGAFVGGSLLVGVFAVHAIKEGDLREDRDEIKEEFDQNAARCRRLGTAIFASADRREPAEEEDTLLLLTDNAGKELMLVPAFTEKPADTAKAVEWLKGERRTGWCASTSLAGLHWQAYAEPISDGAWLQVGKSDNHWRETRERLEEALLPAVICTLLVGAGGAALLTLRILQPVRQLIDTTQRVIQSGDMTARVPAPATKGNELDQLSVLFNQMLARNECLIRGMREALDNVAHDLRTPLTRLRNSAEAALRDREASAQARGDALGDAVEEAENILNVLHVLTEISEARHGAMLLHPEATSVREVALTAADLYEYSAEERGVILRVEVSNELTAIVDRVRLQQIVANLIDNAVKYSTAGGEVVIEAGLSEEGACWLRVKDQGIGISEQDLPRIWDRLYRGDRSRTEPGSGLGLSLVKAVVEAHGGSVEARSSAGKGSVFTVTLPKHSQVHSPSGR